MEKFDKILMKETRGFVEFQSKDEYVVAMVEDLSDWLNYLYHLQGDDELTADNFFKNLNDGVILCKHANLVQTLAETYLKSFRITDRTLPMKIGNQTLRVPLQPPKYTVVDFTKTIFRFHARDNVSNFIQWCRNFNIPASLTFETDDLVVLKNPRIVVVALLEVSRIGRLFGMEVPDIIQLEQEIEDEINQYDKETSFPVTDNKFVYKDSELDFIDTKYNFNDPETDIIKVNEENRHTENFDDIDKHDVETNGSSNQENNSSINSNHFKEPLHKLSTFGFKGRRASVYDSKHQDPLQLSNSKDVSNGNHAMRKTFSTYLDSEEPLETMPLDNFDNESNYSSGSHSKFVIPKYRINRPVGRVKIYDSFDQSNYVKAKKTREKVDLRSLDERVLEILSQCQCDELFLMKRISEGRYQWGDKKTMIFIRILRTHVMVRVGGGWDTLGDFLNKHDPCRKERCDNFKFCLPAHKKRSQSISVESKLLPQPSGIFPGTQFYPLQRFIVDKTTYKRCSLDCGDGIEARLLTEEIRKTEDIVNKENSIETIKDKETTRLSQEIRNNDTNNKVSLPAKNINFPNDAVKILQCRTRVNTRRRSSSICLSHNHNPLLTTITKNDAEQSVISNNNSLSVQNEIRKKSSRIPRLKL